MTVIKLDTSAGHWTAVPRSVAEDLTLSLEARGLLLWFLVKPPNWKINADLARNHLKVSEFLWQKLTKELKSQGYYFVKEGRDKRGRIEKEIVITPTPKKLGDGHQPQIHQGLVNLGATNEKERNILNKNNNNNQVVVDEIEVQVEKDVFEKGLLLKTEFQQVLAVLKNCEHSQQIADELVGAIRARGRGEKGVRMPALFVKAILDVSPDEFYFAPMEFDLRRAKSAARAREDPARIIQKKEVGQVVAKRKPPPEFYEFVKKVKGVEA